MKVIFVKNVPRVGKINEIKEQPDGYVRNFLLPKGFAIIATSEAVKKLERAQNEIKVDREVQVDLFRKNLAAINGMAVTIAAKTNEKGSLFKSIHAKDIADALKKQHHAVISEEYIRLKDPIKHAGEYLVIIGALGVEESVTVNVVSDKK